MKVIAMYLPQFHRVPENDRWWGAGFTDWMTVKDAVSLFENHKQPHIPMDGYYYNLTDKSTMLWQAKLMNQYGIDGMCMYHYWFKDGRKILEKPSENLLKWSDVNMKFCFCWANEAWARSWSNVQNANIWAKKYEKYDAKGREILLEQTYGREEAWREHFLYLLPFFRDNRYIRINEKPIFMIYKPDYIKCLREMMSKWQEWAIEFGLPGLYVLGGASECTSGLDAKVVLEPATSIDRIEKNKGSSSLRPKRYQYDMVWEELLKNQDTDKEAYYNGFVNFDTTPRMGEDGIVLVDGSPQKFAYYLTELLAKNAAKNRDITFINAWNEWGEGMYLEPDEENGHAYLQAVSYAKAHYAEKVDSYKKMPVVGSEKDGGESGRKKTVLYKMYWQMLDRWLTIKEQGKNLGEYLLQHNITTVGIYGMGMMGNHLMRELQDSSIQIVFAIDRKKITNFAISVLSMEDSFPEVDAVIVTVVSEYGEIRKALAEKGVTYILSIEEILFDV